MKNHFLPILCATLLLPFALARGADDVTLNIRFGDQKQLKQVVISLDSANAPTTVQNFKKLVSKRFYNGLAFHRAFPDYLVQTGDPLTRHKERMRVGTGGPGYTIPPEISAKFTRGSVAMGRLPDKINPGRLSNGSQFFVTLKPAKEFNGAYTVFGSVTQGIEILDEISRKSTDSNDYPVERIVIYSAKLGVPAQKAPKVRHFFFF